MKVQLKPISKRAKDRVNQHGDTFTIVEQEDVGGSIHAILVQSLDNTWRGGKWLGWFGVGKDVEIVTRIS
jgi:hypothetical protein